MAASCTLICTIFVATTHSTAMPPREKTTLQENPGGYFRFEKWVSNDQEEHESLQLEDAKPIQKAIQNAIYLAKFVDFLSEKDNTKHQDFFKKYFKTLDYAPEVKGVFERIANLQMVLDNSTGAHGEHTTARARICFTKGRPTPSDAEGEKMAETLYKEREISLFDGFWKAEEIDVLQIEDSLNLWTLYNTKAGIILHELVHFVSNEMKGAFESISPAAFESISNAYPNFGKNGKREVVHFDHIVDVDIGEFWTPNDTEKQSSGSGNILPPDMFKNLQDRLAAEKEGRDFSSLRETALGPDMVTRLAAIELGKLAAALNADSYRVFAQAFWLANLRDARDYVE